MMDDDGLYTFSFQLITLLAFPHKQSEVPLHDLNIFPHLPTFLFFFSEYYKKHAYIQE